MKFGIELEVSGINQNRAAAALRAAGIELTSVAYSHDVMPIWKVVSDSSIRPVGCEVVSPPLKFTPENLRDVATVVRVLKAAGASVNSTTGMHVHVDCSTESSATIANIYNRYRTFEHQIDLFHSPNRRGNNNHYCMSLPMVAPSSRYHKLNLQSFVKYGTVEFRQHAGSLNAIKVANWITFCCEFVVASRVASHVTTTTTINGKSGAIVNLLSAGPMTATALSIAIGVTIANVSCRISRLRSDAGVNIRKHRGMYVLSAAGVDSLFNGISRSVQAHLEARVSS